MLVINLRSHNNYDKNSLIDYTDILYKNTRIVSHEIYLSGCGFSTLISSCINPFCGVILFIR